MPCRHAAAAPPAAPGRDFPQHAADKNGYRLLTLQYNVNGRILSEPLLDAVALLDNEIGPELRVKTPEPTN